MRHNDNVCKIEQILDPDMILKGMNMKQDKKVNYQKL